MSFSDPIGDMLARIKNSQMRNYKKIQMRIQNSRLKLQNPKNEGYIVDFKVLSQEKISILEINLKYNSGNPVINSIEDFKTWEKNIFKCTKFT